MEKENFIKRLFDLEISKKTKQNILIESFYEIEISLKKGVDIKAIIDLIESETGVKINIRYAYRTLQKHRASIAVQEAIKPTQMSVLTQPVETHSELKAQPGLSINHFISMNINDLPEMLKGKAFAVIGGVEYDVRKIEPPYAVFGSSFDEADFASKMIELGYEVGSEQYKENRKVLMIKQKLRREYTSGHSDFKSVVVNSK